MQPAFLYPLSGLGVGLRDVADGLRQAWLAEPRDPLQRRQFDRLAGLPGPAPVHGLGLFAAR